MVPAAGSKEKVAGMNTKLLLITLTTFLSVAEFANAGVMLLVHFGDRAEETYSSANQLVTSYTPNGSNDLTASIYLHLTNGSTLYGYRFSVRFNDGLIGLKTQEQVRSLFGDDPNVKEPLGDPVDQNLVVPLPADFLELRRFNGLLDTGNVVDDRFYKVASLKFQIRKSLQPGDLLINPGKFELYPNDVIPGDAFLTEDLMPLDFVPDPNGGMVAGTSAVPEPASALVLGLLGVLAVARRRRQVAMKAA